jgi:hypothetical protein
MAPQLSTQHVMLLCYREVSVEPAPLLDGAPGTGPFEPTCQND